MLARQSTQTFGRYELLGRLGAGGMAEVFVARCGELEGMQSLVALKRILPHLADDEGFVALFQREAQISLRLRHRAIARVYEVGRVGAAWFLAMELVAGESLAHVLRAEADSGGRKPVDPRVVAFVGAEIASALHHAHALADGASAPLAVIHRDVSPQNVLLGFDGGAKLIDFGVARCVRFSDATRTGTVRGKLAYASPEQVNARPLDGRSDLFSLGIVLHEWLSGGDLFARDSDAATVRAVQSAPIPSLGAWPALDAVLARALARRPDDRFVDGETMAAALLDAVGGRPPAPERLVESHLKALFPDRERRWQAIVAGRELADAAGDATTLALSVDRVETVRGTIPSGPAREADTRAAAPLRPPHRSAIGRRVARRRHPVAMLGFAATVATLATLLFVWRSHDRAIASRPGAPSRTPVAVLPSARPAEVAARVAAGVGAAPVVARVTAAGDPAAETRPRDGIPRRRATATAHHPGLPLRPANRRRGVTVAKSSRSRRAVVDELEPSPYATSPAVPAVR